MLTLVRTFAEDNISLWDILPNEVQEGVKRSLKQSKEGVGKEHDVLMKKYEEWLKK